MISTGAKQSLFNALQTVCQEGDEVIIISPYWLTYPEVVKCCGGVPVYVYATRESGFKITAEQLEAEITPKTKMLIFNSPNNPTGAVYSEDEIRAIAAVCEKHDVLVLADEIYEKLIYGGQKHFSIASVSPKMKELTITVNGVSKSYAMTGWRLGYLAAAPEIAKVISSFQSHATSNVNTMTQYATLAALEGPTGPMEEMVKAFAARRDRMEEILDGMKPLGLDYALSAMFLALLVPQCTDKLHTLTAVLATFLSVAMRYAGCGSWNVVIATIAAATCATIIYRRGKRKDGEISA